MNRKTILAIGLIILALIIYFLLYSWNKNKQNELARNQQQVEQQGGQDTILGSFDDSYITPVSITINDSCLEGENIGETIKLSAICDQLGEARISSSIKAILRPEYQTKILSNNDYGYNVYLEFYENGNKLNIPPYYFPSFADANTAWFKLNISYLDKDNIYISDKGGHEGYPPHYFFNGTEWSKFLPWDLIKNDFPDTIEPPFSVEVSPKHLKITEERYCCDLVYSNTPDREAKRLVFILDRFSKKSLK